jgi:predicted acyltransferase
MNTSNMKDVKNQPAHGRLLSLDALRGLDMLFLVGITGVLEVLPQWADNRVFHFLAGQCQHTKWQGFHTLDLVFPLFIFIAGVSMSFAIGKRLQEGESRKNLFNHVLRRSLILFFLGLVYNQFLGSGWSNFLYTGVLQRIAIAYFFASVIMMKTGIRGQAITAGSLLVVYWLLIILVPVPGFGAGVITPEGNLHAYLDRLLLPGRLGNGVFDEDGILQQISSVAVCLSGVLAGHWLRSSHAQNRKVLGLLAAGIACILTGLIWNLSFPIIFRLWSSSYAMLVIGISAILLALFYWLIDVRGCKKWAFPFVVVGMNSITIYFAQRFFDFAIVVNIFVHGIRDSLGSFQAVFIALCVLVVKWLFLYYLYKKNIFLKV